MARVVDDCRWCRAAMVLLEQAIITDRPVSVCRRCDASPSQMPGNRLWAGPPNLPGSKSGWFLPS